MHEFVLSARKLKREHGCHRARRREAPHGLRDPPAHDLLPARRPRGADDRADRDRAEGATSTTSSTPCGRSRRRLRPSLPRRSRARRAQSGPSARRGACREEAPPPLCLRRASGPRRLKGNQKCHSSRSITACATTTPGRPAFDGDPVGREDGRTSVASHRVVLGRDPNHGLIELEFDSTGAAEAFRERLLRLWSSAGERLGLEARTHGSSKSSRARPTSCREPLAPRARSDFLRGRRPSRSGRCPRAPRSSRPPRRPRLAAGLASRPGSRP